MPELFNVNLDLATENDVNTIAKYGKAFSHPDRIRILKIIIKENRTLTINELSKLSHIPLTTLKFHLNILEEAGMISFFYGADKGNGLKSIKKRLNSITFLTKRTNQRTLKKQKETQVIKVGDYVKFEGKELLYSVKNQVYGDGDEFNSIKREADLIYTPKGIITYLASNKAAKKHDAESLSLVMEICSEAPFYDMKYKSDITFWINDKKILTYQSPGDFGDRKGLITKRDDTSEKYQLDRSQYGLLIQIVVNHNGSYINKAKVSDVTIDDLDLIKGNHIKITFGNDPTSTHCGGFNVFGSNYGDYPKDIELAIEWSEEINN